MKPDIQTDVQSSNASADNIIGFTMMAKLNLAFVQTDVIALAVEGIQCL